MGSQHQVTMTRIILLFLCCSVLMVLSSNAVEYLNSDVSLDFISQSRFIRAADSRKEGKTKVSKNENKKDKKAIKKNKNNGIPENKNKKARKTKRKQLKGSLNKHKAKKNKKERNKNKKISGTQRESERQACM